MAGLGCTLVVGGGVAADARPRVWPSPLRAELVAELAGVGGRLVELEPGAGDRRRWGVYTYFGGTLELVGWDEDTGESEIHESPSTSAMGAWALVRHAGGDLYLGTFPDARLLRFRPSTAEWADLGAPVRGETIIYDLVVGADGRLYGGTHPHGHLFRFDPETGESRDLGQIVDGAKTVRMMASGGDGWLYAGVGPGRQRVVGLNLEVGTSVEVLDAAAEEGYGLVDVDQEGRVWGKAGGTLFELEGGVARARASSDVPKVIRRRLRAPLRDSPRIESRKVSDPVYESRALPVYRLGIGPAGVYAGTALPSQLFLVHGEPPELASLGSWGRGELYSFGSYGEDMVGAAYAGPSPFVVHAGLASPLVGAEIPAAGYRWRMRATAQLGDGLYFGGRVGEADSKGVLARWRGPDDVRVWQSAEFGDAVDAIAAGRERVLLAIRDGGTGRLMSWNPATEEADPGFLELDQVRELTALVDLGDGRVAMFVDRERLLVISVDDWTVRNSTEVGLPVGPDRLYNSMVVGPDGRVWGLWRNGLFAFDVETGTVENALTVANPITAGFAASGDAVYYASGSKIFRVRLAGPAAGEQAPAVAPEVSGGCGPRR